METKIIKAGWIEKRSQYLKKWRKRWLVLDDLTLSTYKTEKDLLKSTMQISLPQIVDASPSAADNLNENTFIVSTLTEKYHLRAINDSEMCAWLNLISHLRTGNRVSSFGSPNYYHESKVLSDESLITSFTKMKEILHTREIDLLQELDEIYKVYVEKATREYQEISDMYLQETQNHKMVSDILEMNDDSIRKIRNIQYKAKASLNFKELDTYNISKLQVSLQEDNLERLIKANIKVCLGNPSEVMIRRTNITRALK